MSAYPERSAQSVAAPDAAPALALADRLRHDETMRVARLMGELFSPASQAVEQSAAAVADTMDTPIEGGEQ